MSETQGSSAGTVGVPTSLAEQLFEVARCVALEELASGIAHELNQPLGASVTFAEAGERILQRPDAPLANVGEVLQSISKEALAAAATIRRIRHFLARNGLSTTRCSMAEIIQELTPLLQPLATQARVTLELDLQPDLPQVNVDRPTKPRGTGLGLAAARAIIEAHQGSSGFVAESQGTRFWFKVPACEQR